MQVRPALSREKYMTLPSRAPSGSELPTQRPCIRSSLPDIYHTSDSTPNLISLRSWDSFRQRKEWRPKFPRAGFPTPFIQYWYSRLAWRDLQILPPWKPLMGSTSTRQDVFLQGLPSKFFSAGKRSKNTKQQDPVVLCCYVFLCNKIDVLDIPAILTLRENIMQGARRI